MAETYTAAALLALEAQPYREEAFVEFSFPGLTYRISSLARDYVVEGELYAAAGPLGSISVISENADMTADPIAFILTGLEPNLAAALRDFNHQGSPVTVKMVYFDANDVYIPDPVQVFAGVVDTMSWVIGATLEITVTCDSYIRLMWRGPDGRRRVQGDQEQIFPGEKGLEFKTRLIQERDWGVPGKIAGAQSTATERRGGPSGGFGRG